MNAIRKRLLQRLRSRDFFTRIFHDGFYSRRIDNCFSFGGGIVDEILTFSILLIYYSLKHVLYVPRKPLIIYREFLLFIIILYKLYTYLNSEDAIRYTYALQRVKNFYGFTELCLFMILHDIILQELVWDGKVGGVV